MDNKLAEIEIFKAAKNLERQEMYHPALKAMEYWKTQTPTFLENLGKAAKSLALIRQDQYFQAFNQMIEDGMDPLEAKQMAETEILFQPKAESDQTWTANQLNLTQTATV